jgi:hypothetical protein
MEKEIKMKTHFKVYDPYGDFRKNPEKVKSLVKLYPRSQRPLAEKAAELVLKMKLSRAEFLAQKTMKIARIMDQLQSKFSKTQKKEDPAVVIDVGLTGSEGFDPFHYVASYGGITLALSNVLILDKDVAWINFTFPNGLPPGYYGIWLSWLPFSGQKECKIKCGAGANPVSAVNPNTTIVKSTVPASSSLLSGIDMAWEIVSTNERVIFCIANASGEYLACLGVTMIGIF